MTLFLILGVLIFIGCALLAVKIGNDSPLFLIPPVVFIIVFVIYSVNLSEDHYFDPEIKSIEIQKAIIKDTGAFLLYKIEGEEEEKAENTKYLITDEPSHLLITKPKPNAWWFINMASKTETIYLNKEDLKRWL